jgi:hypothetical protein
MKNLIIICIALIPFISGCKKESETDTDLTIMQIREIAWNYINAQQKSTVNVDWKQAPVAESGFNGVKAYVVSFNTNEDALLGPIMVYVDMAGKVALGQAMRD